MKIERMLWLAAVVISVAVTYVTATRVERTKMDAKIDALKADNIIAIQKIQLEFNNVMAADRFLHNAAADMVGKTCHPFLTAACNEVQKQLRRDPGAEAVVEKLTGKKVD